MSACDFYNLIAERRGMPEGWQWFRLKHVGGEGDEAAVLVTGAVCTAVYKSGKRKGQTNWKHRDKATETEFVVFASEMERTKRDWERITARCAKCGGSGSYPRRMLFGVGVPTIVEREPCKSCGGTGNAVRP